MSQTGGHIGAGLGVVELTVALCYSFDSPRDKIVWDVGHQAYPWKILTGRNERLPTLRQPGGLSGFLRRSESAHDQFGAGHAGTGLSAAFGIAAARDLKGEQYKVVGVVGDGALTCGLPYEAMNNAGHSGRDIIMVLNDNGMSIAPNVGAINRYLGSIIASPITVRIRELVKGMIERASHVVGGQKLVDFAKTMEESIKNLWSPGMLFEELGFRYFGPIDGHNIAQMVQTFEIVKTLRGPRVVHVITEKGRGFPLPEPDLEKYHARAPYDPVTGKLKPVNPGPPQWTKVFGEAITQLAAEYPSLVAITAAMPSGTGTNIFQKKWPERFFDVGIAEAHATTFAAGLATQGIRPVVAIYSTFLQRAYDSIIHDVAIQQLPVIFCMDRAGMVGEDGQTHMGLYDIAYMLALPNMTVTAPKDGAELIGLLRCALERSDGPFSLRYPRDKAPAEAPPAAEVAPVPYGSWEVLRRGRDCALLAVGVMCRPA
ncbi:MAG: 1-deoxy-D-xylulose-5-phosphate synthase, partial [Gemmatimonadetes bacterium 13_1_40CM_3_70_8]